MKARLIACTKAHNAIGLETAQDLIAYCARVSNPSNQMNTETSEKLIKYLIKHKDDANAIETNTENTCY